MANSRARLKHKVQGLLEASRKEQETRRLATVQAMEQIDRRLRHVAVLIANWDLRYVIPRLADLAEMFPHAEAPRKEGLCDAVSVRFNPVPEYPVKATVTVSMRPDPPVERIRITFSVSLVPYHLPHDGDSSIDVLIQAPDTKAIEEFLDDRIVRFVKDYLKVRNPDSPYHEEQKVTDPVCQMTFSVAEAAAEATYGNRTYYFCIEPCREKFLAAPERYLEGGRAEPTASFEEMSS